MRRRPHPATYLVRRLVGLDAWDVLTGPAGASIQFGPLLEDNHSYRVGQYSVWIKCPIKLMQHGRSLLPEDLPDELRPGTLHSVLDGSRVLRAAIDPRDWSLRLLFSERVLLSCFPREVDTDECWIVFDHSTKPACSVAVYRDRFSGEWPGAGDRQPGPTGLTS